MRFVSSLAMGIAVVTSCGSVWAQAVPTAGGRVPAPAIEPVLSVIPAGTCGYIMTSSVRRSSDAIQGYLQTIGLAEVLRATAPCDLLKEAAGLGNEFNPDGGCAIVLLDLKQFEIDMVAELKGAEEPEDLIRKLPLVLLIPGASVQGVFSQHKMDEMGAHVRVKLPIGDVYAAKVGGYIALSPLAKAVDLVRRADRRASSELSPRQSAVLTEALAGAHVNMKVSGPVILALLDMAAKELVAEIDANAGGDQRKAAVRAVEFVQSIFRDECGQIEAVDLTLQPTKTGLVIRHQIAAVPGSDKGREYAAFEPIEPPRLDGLPGVPYLLAIGVASPKTYDPSRDRLLKLILAMPNLRETTRAKILKRTTPRPGQVVKSLVSSRQLVVCEMPKGSGKPGFAAVIGCDDAVEAKDVFSEATCIIVEALAPLLDFKPDSVIAHGAEKVGSLPVDVIDIHDALSDKTPWEKLVETVTGSNVDKVRLVAADEKTLVVTMTEGGGGKAFLAEAIKAAQNGGPIAREPGIVEGMMVLPKNLNLIAALELGNLSDLLNRMDEEGELPRLKIRKGAPVVIGCATAGNTADTVVYVPNALARQIADGLKDSLRPVPEDEKR